MILELTLAILCFVLGLSLFAFVPLIFGAPFEPSRKKVLKQILDLANVKKGKRIVDLGSGDGRIVIAFAKKGTLAVGYEINPWLVLYSRRQIKKQGLKNRAKIYWRSFWNISLKDFDVVVTFQIGYIMNRLQKKLKKELKKGARVISHQWRFKNWKISEQKGKVRLYVK